MKFNIYIMLSIAVLILAAMTLAAGCDDDDDDDDDNDDAADDDATDDDEADDDSADDDDDDDDNDTSGGDVWTDSVTGYMWQNGVTTQLTWSDAIAYCNDLAWGGYSDWHLPTISELRTLIRGCDATAPGGSCGVTDSCLVYATCWNETCWECEEGQGPADGHFWPAEIIGPAGWHWSSSEQTDFPGWAWAIPFYGGDIDGYDITLEVYVRCVR